jgi:hypothetical protein
VLREQNPPALNGLDVHHNGCLGFCGAETAHFTTDDSGPVPISTMKRQKCHAREAATERTAGLPEIPGGRRLFWGASEVHAGFMTRPKRERRGVPMWRLRHDHCPANVANSTGLDSARPRDSETLMANAGFRDVATRFILTVPPVGTQHSVHSTVCSVRCRSGRNIIHWEESE